MSFAREFSLHPQLVEDVVQELLEADIISPNEIKNLKSENRSLKYDPIMVMDSRHEQVRLRSTVTPKENRSEVCRISEKTGRKVEIDYIKVNKEIEKFKKELELERKKLYEINRISNGRNQNVKQKHLFQQPVPITNIVTQLKSKDNESNILSDNDEKKKGSPLIKCELKIKNNKPIEINGYKPLSMKPQINIKRCLNEKSPVCPHKMAATKAEEKVHPLPNFDENSKTNILMTDNKIIKTQSINNHSNANNKLVSNTVNKWKLFVIRQQNFRCSKHEELMRIKRRKYLSKKYWNKWFEYYKNKKRAKDEIIKKKNRMEKLNMFFERLQEIKKDLVKTDDVESFHNITNIQNGKNQQINNKVNKIIPIDKNAVFANRLKAQKDIIQEQKMKLEEQTRLIKQLKEEKLKESIKEFQKNLQLNVKEAVKNCEKNLKPKAKLLANKLNINTEMEKLQDDYFVTRMNERAEKRKEKWEIIRLRKQLKEEEIKRKQIEEDERKQEEEEQERRRKFKEKKEKIRAQKENELKRLQETEEMKRKIKKADDFFMNCLKRKIINILQINLELEKKREKHYEIYYNERLMEKTFSHWREKSRQSVMEKVQTVETFYKHKLLERCWTNWIMFYSESVQKYQVAVDFYDTKLTEKTFYAWKEFTEEQIIENFRKTECAASHYYRNLIRKCFNKWRLFPHVIRNIREEEKRIRSWREKVLEIIPDFNPEIAYNDEEEDSDNEE